jgi:serine phosphatase RsbU (regulator of sigma subunit)
MVVDGLGHGPFAADAAREAERVFAECNLSSPAAVLQDVHDALKKTRGAAAAVALIDEDSNTVSVAGVGNISASLITSHGSRGIASHYGTLGHHMHSAREYQLPWTSDSVLVMHSDGISSRWDLREFNGIWSHDASVIAGVLYRDFARQKDDATVLVAKNRQ